MISVVKKDEKTPGAICEIPRTTASILFFPLRSCCATFSDRTIASSINKPMATNRATRVIIFSV